MGTYIGTVSEKSDLRTCDDDGTKVINMVVKTTKTLVGSVKVAVRKTVVLFRGEAVLANQDIKIGDHVCFSEVERNPRAYETARGKTVELVDMIAQSFDVIKPKDFKDNLDALMELNISEGELTFTDDDRASLASAKVVAASDDDEIPFGN